MSLLSEYSFGLHIHMYFERMYWVFFSAVAMFPKGMGLELTFISKVVVPYIRLRHSHSIHFVISIRCVSNI